MKSLQTEKEGGIGLLNIKRRLDLLFEGNYVLNIKDEKEIYMVVMEFRLL